MKVIRDEEGFGLFMIPLFSQWKVKRCNVDGCTDRPTTIILDAHPEAPCFGLCDVHHKICEETGELDFRLVFDSFDAFNATEVVTASVDGGRIEKG